MMYSRVLMGIILGLIGLWAVGLCLSSIKTKQSVEQFYQWAHNDDSLTYDSYTMFIDETAPSLKERFEKADRAFKKHVEIEIGTMPMRKPLPWPRYTTQMGSSSNGCGFQMGFSLISNYYFAHIRTEKEPGDKVFGVMVIAVERSLFGL